MQHDRALIFGQQRQRFWRHSVVERFGAEGCHLPPASEAGLGARRASGLGWLRKAVRSGFPTTAPSSSRSGGEHPVSNARQDLVSHPATGVLLVQHHPSACPSNVAHHAAGKVM
jgi:hypothetical protein